MLEAVVKWKLDYSILNNAQCFKTTTRKCCLCNCKCRWQDCILKTLSLYPCEHCWIFKNQITVGEIKGLTPLLLWSVQKWLTVIGSGCCWCLVHIIYKNNMQDQADGQKNNWYFVYLHVCTTTCQWTLSPAFLNHFVFEIWLLVVSTDIVT